ncbi:MAG: PAS domain-containing protein [Draconibacterium sp.]|nr:PAS domain-containing protein [Draconibacterium sp.]
MSEFTKHNRRRAEGLEELFYGILKGEKLGQLVRENQGTIDGCVPADVVAVVDVLVAKKVPMAELKTGINKLLNLLHKTLTEYPYYRPDKDCYLGCLVENNRLMEKRLLAIKPLFRDVNKKADNDYVKSELLEKLSDLEKFGNYYTIKENLLFPVIEKYVTEYRCLQVMWSFHDDIRRNLKSAIKMLRGELPTDMKLFNRWVGDLFFNMYAVKFREERILFPLVQSVVDEDILNDLLSESVEIGFPYYQPEIALGEESITQETDKKEVDLETGILSVEQIKLLFNHLPVDITFVDENNKVKYFSTPKKRIFPRTKSVIGRDVHNCHPPESVHVVEQIVESFRDGKKDVASFWINMRGELLLIQYFAVRDEDGNYKGVVEVSQEISEIRNLKGENRLLDWEN